MPTYRATTEGAQGLSLPRRTKEVSTIRGQAPIAQLAEAADLKSAQSGFESQWGHFRLPGHKRFRAVRWSVRTDSDAAYRPGSPALPGLGELGDGDLLFSGGQVGAGRVAQSTVSLPGVLVELHATVEAVAGVDGPVTA